MDKKLRVRLMQSCSRCGRKPKIPTLTRLCESCRKKCARCGKEEEGLCPVDYLCSKCHIEVFGTL